MQSRRPSKDVASEIGDRGAEKSVAVPAGSWTVRGMNSCFSSGDLDRTLAEFGLSDLEAMARAKADEMGPCLNVGSGGEFVPVGSSTVPTIVEATWTKSYSSQSAKSL